MGTPDLLQVVGKVFFEVFSPTSENPCISKDYSDSLFASSHSPPRIPYRIPLVLVRSRHQRYPFPPNDCSEHASSDVPLPTSLALERGIDQASMRF